MGAVKYSKEEARGVSRVLLIEGDPNQGTDRNREQVNSLPEKANRSVDPLSSLLLSIYVFSLFLSRAMLRKFLFLVR
jgi:hypothetical protein